MELSLLILVCIYKSYIVLLGNICRADKSWIFIFLVMEKSWKVNVEKEGAPCFNIAADDILFSRILSNEHHVLKPLLPDKRSHGYSLRPRRHNLSIAMKDDDCKFITRQLFKDIY